MPSIFEVGIFEQDFFSGSAMLEEFFAITSPTPSTCINASVWYNSDCVMACIKFIWRIIEEQNSSFRIIQKENGKLISPDCSGNPFYLLPEVLEGNK